MSLLTKREQKIAECIVESIHTQRQCDSDKNTVQQVTETVQAIDAVIEALGDGDAAEELLPWEQSLYD